MNPVLGIGLKVLSTLVFTAMASGVRLVHETVPTGELVFFRSFFALIPVVAWVAWRGQLRTGLKTQRLSGHLVRGATGLTAMFLGFVAVRNLPLVDATAIGFAAPLITVVLAVLILGERVRVYRWTAVVVGLAGVLVMLSPHLGGTTTLLADRAALGAGAAFTAACLVALTMIIVRRLTATETTAAIVLYFSINSSLISLLTAPSWIAPTARDAALLVGIGLLGGVGQLLLTESYRWAEASMVAPFDYTAMVWAIVLGFALFGEVPSAAILAGAAIVVAAGLLVAWRERRLGLSRRE